MNALHTSALGYALRFARAVIPASVRGSRLYQCARHTILSHDEIYDHEYYKDVEKCAVESASVMAGSIVERFPVKSVIDVGCGTGALLEAFRIHNCEVCGLEYSEVGIAFCVKRGLPVRKFDLERDQIIDVTRYDIATSFEVAEHLPVWCANRYVKLLCQFSPLVVMSAATPGQGGTDHINEQSHSYWIRKFNDNNYSLDKTNSKRLASIWKESGVAAFYYNNVMIFRTI